MFSVMKKWKKITYMVAIFLFLIELRPLEPFMTAYLIGPDVGLSLNEVATSIEYIRIYGSLLTSVLMLITADYFLYKPNIIFLTVSSCVFYILMATKCSITQLKVSAFGIGIIHSVDKIAFCYLYAKIKDVEQYQRATSIAIVAVQLGKVVGNILAQIIVNATGEIYTILPYCLLLATIWACLFPSVEQKSDWLKSKEPCENSSLLKYGLENKTKNIEQKRNTIEIDKQYEPMGFFSKEVWINFKSSYSNPIVLKKSLWYIVGMGANILFVSNINILYSFVVEKPGNHDVLLNGLAEAMVTLSGAAGAYLIGKVKCDWKRYGDIFTAFGSIVMGTLIMPCYFYDKLIFLYLSNILFGLLFHMIMVIIYAEIGKQLKKQCYSLVLGFNFIASSLTDTIFTLILVQYNFLDITIPGRFLFIGGLFLMLGIIFLFISLFEIKRSKILY